MNQARFFQYLRYEKRYSPHTLTAYESDLGQFTDFLENMYAISAAAEVTHFHIRSWMVDLLQRGNTARSINRKLSCLKTYFKFLRKQGEIKNNPMAKVIAPKTGKRLPVFVNEDSMALLFERVDFGCGFAGARNRLVMEMLYCTGMRRSELVGLKIENVDFSSNQLKVLGKGNKERLITIARHLVALKHAYIKLRHAEYPESPHPNLFLTNKGQPLNPGFVYKLGKR